MELEALSSAWEQHGWLLLPRFFSPGEVAAINGVVDRLWERRPGEVTVDDIDRNERMRMSRLSPDRRSHRIKISDLYLTAPEVREILLDDRLVAIVRRLLGEQPVLCNSLNLEHSSAQEYHADSLYMTPATEGRLVACWIALEDVRPGSGPLRLYPGSHRLPPYVFADGSRHAIAGEMPRWAAYMQGELDARAMQPVTIMANTGDLVLWHADLLHGAEEIRDPSSTRRSLVAHYFGRADVVRTGYRIAGKGWLQRRPQPVDRTTRILSAIERRLARLRAAVHRWRA